MTYEVEVYHTGTIGMIDMPEFVETVNGKGYKKLRAYLSTKYNIVKIKTTANSKNFKRKEIWIEDIKGGK